MSEEESRKLLLQRFSRIGAMLIIWLALSWEVADSMLESHTRERIRLDASAVEAQTEEIAHSIDLSLDFMHGIPALVAQDELLIPALARFGSKNPATLPVEKLKARWSQDALLQRLNTYLSRISASLNADVVWITNAAGDCIASSNADKPESFVGTNYADRDYYRLARQGLSGKQYAMGRKTNIPGLFFSAPILRNGQFAGVAVAKIDLTKLQHWLSQADAFITDEHGVVILAHDRTLEMLSLPTADIVKLSAAERQARYKRTDFPVLSLQFWDPVHFPTVLKTDQRAQPLVFTTRPISDESLVLHVFGATPAVSVFPHERLKLFLLIGVSGALVLSIGSGFFFYARIRKTSKVRQEKIASLLRTALESTVDGILVVSNDGRILAYNHRFMEIWNIPLDIAASGSAEKLLKAIEERVIDRQGYIDRLLELSQLPAEESFDTIQLKSGLDIERYSLPHHLGEQIVGRVWSFRDVTLRNDSERALRESRDELESKVQRRTADLQTANDKLQQEQVRQAELIKQLAEAHSQLLQSEKMASIGQLAAGVAHEINNPVGYVNSNLTTLQQYVADLFKLLDAYAEAENEYSEPTRSRIAAFKKNVDIAYLRDDIGKLLNESANGLQRVKRIVLDLKDFSHVSDSERLWANLERGMESTLNVVWNELKYKTEVIKEYGGIPDIECIPSQINQVFMNLLVNAAQAIKEHGKIIIRTGQAENSVWVEVEDTGSGIPADNLSRIFEPFFTTKPVGTGTGLGLSLSYNIVRKHGGQITVRSEVGKGSVFRVTLPIQSALGTKEISGNNATLPAAENAPH